MEAAMSTNSLDVTANRSEEHTSELQSLRHLVCRLLLEKKNTAEEHMCFRSLGHVTQHDAERKYHVQHTVLILGHGVLPYIVKRMQGRMPWQRRCYCLP